jgi:enoyl-CoA hydratase
MMDYKEVYKHYEEGFLLLEVSDNIATITINRPERMNSVAGNIHYGIEELLQAFNYDPEVRAVVIQGAGDRAFCAGADLQAMSEGGSRQTDSRILEAGGQPGAVRLLQHYLALSAPSVACINGDAVGLGASFALMCDVTVMADTARIGDTHVRAGLVAGDGGALMWPMLMGMNKAKWYLMTGELMNAQQALDVGLVNWVVPKAEVREQARARAKQLAEGAPLAVRWTKAALNQQIWRQMIDVQQYAFATESITLHSEDNIEAAKAFMEKRPPKFAGR